MAYPGDEQDFKNDVETTDDEVSNHPMFPMEYGDFVCDKKESLIRVNCNKIAFYNMTGLQGTALKSRNNDYIYYTDINDNHKNTQNNDKYMQYFPKNDVWKFIEPNQQQPPNEWKRKTNIVATEETTFVVVIGKTGLGKSSIIRLLTKDPFIEVSDDGCCTQKSQLYQPLYNNNDSNIIFIDTMGTQDSDENKSDESILNDIQRQIYDKKGKKVKFIWVVPHEIRPAGYLKTQAKFIHQFGIHPDTFYNNINNIDNNEIKQDDNNNIWDSVLMIVSKPQPHKLKGSAKGAISLSQEYGAKQKQWNTKTNLIGFLNIDWIPKKHNKLSDKSSDKSSHESSDESEDESSDDDDESENNSYETICTNPKLKKQFHYYNNKEIESMIFKYLSNDQIKPFNIIFKDYKCNKCDLVCDPRFVNDQKCHPTPTIIYKRHPNNIKPEIKHISEITGKHKKIHWGKRLRVHTQPLEPFYHKNKLRLVHTKSTELTLPGTIIATLGTASLFTGFVGAVIGIGLATSAWSKKCEIYPCCNGDKDSKGCQLLYPCCKGDKNSKGCEQKSIQDLKYPCCDYPYDSAGCYAYFSCCGKEKGSIGCQVRCETCNAVLDDKQSGSDSNKNGKKCGFVWPCCGAHGKITKLNDPKKNNGYTGCKDACRNCEGILCESKGCISYPDAKHDMKPMD